MHEARLAVDLERGEEQFYPPPSLSPVPSTNNLAAAAGSTGGLHRRHPSSNSILQQHQHQQQGTSASAPMSPALQGRGSRAPSLAAGVAAAGQGGLLEGAAGNSGEMSSTLLAGGDTTMEVSEVSGVARTPDTSFAPETTSNTGITGGTASASDEMEGEVASISSADASAYLSPSPGPGMAPHSPLGGSPVQHIK
jgi:hypothetical protein